MLFKVILTFVSYKNMFKLNNLLMNKLLIAALLGSVIANRSFAKRILRKRPIKSDYLYVKYRFQLCHSNAHKLQPAYLINLKLFCFRYSDKNHILCTERRCSTAILSSFILPPILCIPTYMVRELTVFIIVKA